MAILQRLNRETGLRSSWSPTTRGSATMPSVSSAFLTGKIVKAEAIAEPIDAAKS